MNVKIKALTAGVLFFIGGQAVMAQKTKKDTLKSEKAIDEVVSKQGFDERLKNDYLGSIRARLEGLMVGAKGLMLNTPRSINF